MIGYIFKRALKKSKNRNSPEFVKEPSPSKLVKEWKMAVKTWLTKQNVSFKIG
jgi:hypothetical protein